MDCIKPQAPEMDLSHLTELEINRISASNLKPAGKLFRTKVYARISIGGDLTTEKKTPVDRHGKTNPAWNFTTKHTIHKSAVQHDFTMLVIKLYCERWWIKDQYMGEVHVSLNELYRRSCNGSNTVEYKVKKGSVDSEGKLKFSYRFVGNKADEKPSFVWERTIHDVTMLLLKVSLIFIFGIDIPI